MRLELDWYERLQPGCPASQAACGLLRRSVRFVLFHLLLKQLQGRVGDFRKSRATEGGHIVVHTEWNFHPCACFRNYSQDEYHLFWYRSQIRSCFSDVDIEATLQ